MWTARLVPALFQQSISYIHFLKYRHGFIRHPSNTQSEWRFLYFAYFLLSVPVEVGYWDLSSLTVCIQRLLRFAFVSPEDKQNSMKGVVCTFTSINLTVEWEVLIRGGGQKEHLLYWREKHQSELEAKECVKSLSTMTT